MDRVVLGHCVCPVFSTGTGIFSTISGIGACCVCLVTMCALSSQQIQTIFHN